MYNYRILLTLFLGLYLVRAKSQEAGIFALPERIKYDERCLQIDGKDQFIYSGTFHYFRVPKELWAQRFKKMKEAGFNGVETYVPWNWHERNMPRSVSDYSKLDLTELNDWLSMAESFGFYITVRPGPYICAEWDGGGFPQWLMQKRPAKTTSEVWLQSDDPEFLKWNKHWYDAVCKVVRPHQLTHRSVGTGGVILFQVENEYNRVRWFSNEIKTSYLEFLTTCAKAMGIDVPIMTCWTDQTRNVKSGPLKGMVDFVNAYPKWNVENGFGGIINTQLKTQPGKPLMSMELQAGLYSEIGGRLSKDIDGISPTQSQNITLYALQRGFSFINFYMLCGGTNFDDWASRQTTTTYDFGAAIQENGGVNNRYDRLAAIGKMLQEHGTRLLRSYVRDITARISDPQVEVLLRCAEDGSRYFFVRTEDRSKVHFGTINIAEKNGQSFAFDFSLEPFGSKIYYLPPNASETTSGEWLPKPRLPERRPAVLADSLVFLQTESMTDNLPKRWTRLPPGRTIDNFGIYNRHYIYYRAAIPAGKSFQVSRTGDQVVNGSDGDRVLAYANGQLLNAISEDKESITYQMPVSGKYVILLFENKGIHQHSNKAVETHWMNGIQWIKVDGKALPLEFASQEKENGLKFSEQNRIPQGLWKTISLEKDSDANNMLVWNRIQFSLPEKKTGIWFPWHLHMKAEGNGFIYLNGRCLGRYWGKGPQTDYYLPESWLKFGDKSKNIIAFSLLPVMKGSHIHGLSVTPDYDSAEFR